jgi:poly-gamma-glutamate synthesis protein (capsule biosynthesis protein)
MDVASTGVSNWARRWTLIHGRGTTGARFIDRISQRSGLDLPKAVFVASAVYEVVEEAFQAAVMFKFRGGLRRGRRRKPAVILFLCGDVMTGRGVDQILPRPGDPRLRERYVRDARTYVELAENVNGPIIRPVAPTWPWGEALRVLAQTQPDARVINLETSFTDSDDVAAGKAVHYRMHPANIGCLAAARPDACVLANNHVLDFGHRGLTDTLHSLAEAGIAAVGAGRDLGQARQPAVLYAPSGGRVLVFAAGTDSSGIPPDWAATPQRPGVNLLPTLATGTADEIGAQVGQLKQPGDVVVFSVHWGSNWGYDVPSEHIGFAHRLIDQGVDIVHGHSSHHPRPIEVYRDRLILYGTGDFIDDYEGITGHEEYRDDLRLMYFPTLQNETGVLLRLGMAPLQVRRMRLHRTSEQDAEYLCDVLNEISQPFGSRVELGDDVLELVREA